MMAVLKADAYGHGAVTVARCLADLEAIPLWGFGVSSVEEGAALRQAGFQQPILILGSLYPFSSFETALAQSLTPTVASRMAAQALGETAQRLGRRTAVHVEIDTGMGRTGVSPETAGEVFADVAAAPSLFLEGVYTHFAKSESAAEVGAQLERFAAAKELWKDNEAAPLIHAANSAAFLRHPRTHFDMVRPGLALYGVASGGSAAAALKPAMSWKTRIVFLKKVKADTPISYAATFRTSRPSWIATLPVGYADGYPRSFSNKGWVLVRGVRCPVVGRVTMDHVMVDVTDAQPVDVGQEAVLMGNQEAESVAAHALAKWAGTIPYEILCGVSNRVPRVVV